jgi:hypothetical protein
MQGSSPAALGIIVVLATIAAQPTRSQVAAAGSASDSAVRQAMNRLASYEGSQLPEDFHLPEAFAPFYEHPEEAARQLVAALRPVHAGKYPEFTGPPPTVWYIRALRALTGLDFQGRTRVHIRDADERWFLCADSTSSVRFFGTWMSRDQTFVAPQDAQREIIARWKAWFQREGHLFRYVNIREVDRWYF